MWVNTEKLRRAQLCIHMAVWPSTIFRYLWTFALRALRAGMMWPLLTHCQRMSPSLLRFVAWLNLDFGIQFFKDPGPWYRWESCHVMGRFLCSNCVQSTTLNSWTTCHCVSACRGKFMFAALHCIAAIACSHWREGWCVAELCYVFG